MTSSSRQRLLNLEAIGDSVFHGTGRSLSHLEPRQAHNFIDGINHKDGAPAVFASSRIDYAILMAIVNKKNCPKGSRSKAETDGSKESLRLSMAIGDKTYAQLTDKSEGYVYVFDRKQFKPRNENGVEYISYEKVVPIEIIKVRKEDLASDIDIFIE